MISSVNLVREDGLGKIRHKTKYKKDGFNRIISCNSSFNVFLVPLFIPLYNTYLNLTIIALIIAHTLKIPRLQIICTYILDPQNSLK